MIEIHKLQINQEELWAELLQTSHPHQKLLTDWLLNIETNNPFTLPSGQIKSPHGVLISIYEAWGRFEPRCYASLCLTPSSGLLLGEKSAYYRPFLPVICNRECFLRGKGLLHYFDIFAVRAWAGVRVRLCPDANRAMPSPEKAQAAEGLCKSQSGKVMKWRCQIKSSFHS